MKATIKYPKIKCPICGETFTKKHNRQKYCSQECREEADKINNRKRQYRYYHKHKNRINQTKIGTRTIGPHKHPHNPREAEIVQNEIKRIGLNSISKPLDYNMKVW